MKPCNKSPDCLHPACIDCDRLIRLAHHPITDHPGTVRGVISRSVCETHNQHRLQDHENMTPQERIRHENTVRGLNNFMARIRGKSRV